MATKKTEKKPVDNDLKVIVRGQELSINETLPEEVLEKNHEGSPYIPIDIIRDVMRQIGGFASPKFSKKEMVAKGDWKGKSVYLWQQTVELDYNGEVLHGEGEHPVTAGKMFSSAATGAFSTLRSKCLRDALKYKWKIFEYPEPDDAPEISKKDATVITKTKTTGEIGFDEAKPKDGKPTETGEVKDARQEEIQEIIDAFTSCAEAKEDEKEDAQSVMKNCVEAIKKLNVTAEEKKLLMPAWKKADDHLKSNPK